MITIAKVVETNGKTAVVEAARKSACDGCHKLSDGQSCTVCSLLGGEKTIRATAKNDVGAEAGDVVQIESATGRMMLYAVLVFLLPVVTAIISYVVARLFGANETIRLLSALAGFVAVMTADIIISKTMGKTRCDVNIVKIIK